MPTTSDLLTYLFDGQPHSLTSLFEYWLASKRFRAWTDANRAKIRKKVRGVPDAETLRDLRFELETAYLLVQERRFTVVYEYFAAEKARGPDFTVTFGSLRFNVEVTRLRASNVAFSDVQMEAVRLVDAACAKLRQLPPGSVNVLVIVADDLVVEGVDLAQEMQRLKTLAERGEGMALSWHRFRDTAEFFRYYMRLSGVVLRGTWEDGAGRPLVLWGNPQAKHPVPSNLRTILGRWQEAS
jgi:hypothetical protein